MRRSNSEISKKIGYKSKKWDPNPNSKNIICPLGVNNICKYRFLYGCFKVFKNQYIVFSRHVYGHDILTGNLVHSSWRIV